MENRIRSDGAGKPEIGYMHLYTNQWILVNKIRFFADGDILRIHALWQFYIYETYITTDYGLHSDKSAKNSPCENFGLPACIKHWEKFRDAVYYIR